MSEEVTGYDALNFDGLERRGNYRFIAYREDMLHALDKKDAAATIYQIVYRWQVEYKREEVLRKIDERKKSGLKPYTQEEVEDMMFVYMSYNDFVHESGGAIGYNTVIRTLDYLVDKKKALKQRPNHDPKYPDFEYSVNKEVVRELLKALPPDPAFAPKIPKKKNRCTQMGTPENEENQSTQMGIGSTQTGIPSTQMGTEVYPNGGTSQELTSNTQELTGKTSLSSSDDAPSHQSEKERELEKEVDGLKAQIAQLLQAFKDSNYPPEPPKGSASPTLAGRNNTVPDGENSPTQEPTFPQSSALPEKTEPPFLDNAVQEPPNRQKTGSAETQPINTQPAQDTPSESQRRGQESTSSTQAVNGTSNQATEQEKQASGVSDSQSTTQKTQRGRGSKNKEKLGQPQLSEEEKAKEAQYDERRRFWQNKINERRGGPLRTRGLCINETECLNTLVREFDDIDIGRIDRHLATEHWKYKKNPAEIGGKALLDESRPTLQYLKTKGGQSSNGSSQQTPTPIKASMTHDEACKLAHDAIEQAKQYNIVVVAQAVSSKNNPDVWMVRVKWDDGSKDGFPFPLIKVREQWDRTLTEIRKIIKEEAKQAARSVARMQEAK